MGNYFLDRRFNQLSAEYNLTSSQTGLVFTAFGTAYTVFTPLFGFLSDKARTTTINILALFKRGCQKMLFFSGPATKREGGGGKSLATNKKKLFLKL